MKPSEMRQKSVQELSAMLKESKEELFNLKMQHAIGRLEKTHRLKEVKRDIARFMTLLAQKRSAL